MGRYPGYKWWRSGNDTQYSVLRFSNLSVLFIVTHLVYRFMFGVEAVPSTSSLQAMTRTVKDWLVGNTVGGSLVDEPHAETGKEEKRREMKRRDGKGRGEAGKE